jgi:polyisoprenoid-binding protein YceI
MILRRECSEFPELSNRLLSYIVLALATCAAAFAQPQELHLDFSPANTAVTFTLGDVLHTVHGSFKLKRGDVGYNFATGAVQGTLVFDATSANSGNHSRDRKMHREILETGRYPEITFRPDRVQGSVAHAGVSTVAVHGTLSIHGADHEMTIPVRVELSPEHWTAYTHFTIPYVKWGMKNPSSFLLRVSESVEVDIHAAGSDPFPKSAPSSAGAVAHP